MQISNSYNLKKPGRGMVYLKKNLILYLFLVIPVAYFIIFRYLPMYGIVVAFKDYNIFAGVENSPWVGLDVFKRIFGMKEFFIALRNTITLNLIDMAVNFPAPIILAIILSEIPLKRFKRFAQTIMYMPYFLSWVVIGGISVQIFATDGGIVNNFLRSIGLENVRFLTNETNWLITYVGLGLWQSVGWNTIIYLAAISGINTELYEAATVDGAGRLRKIWHITLPGIKPTIVVLLILAMGRMVQIGFDRPFNIGNPLVRGLSDVISTFVYRYGLQSFQFDVATAVGLFQSVVGMIFLLTTNYIAEKLGERGVV